MPMDNVTLENTQQSISSRDAKSVASVMVNGKWVNLSDTLEQANVKSDVGTVAKQVAAQQEVVSNAVSVADSAQSAADAAVASAQVTSDAVSAIASATAEAKQGANDALSRAKSAWDVATNAKSAVTDFDPLLKSAQSDASNAIAQIADTASALSDAKAAFTSDVAVAKNLASTAQTTADNAVKSASSVANDLTAVASQAKSNADGITKVTSDVGLLQTTVADNSGNISTIQETAKQIQQAVSDNAGNITVAKQTADSAATVASDARSNATVAIQTASQASITAKNASGQAASAVITASGAMTTASNAKSDATVAVQTAGGASLTAINANSDATVAKQTASEAKVQASNAESDFAQLSIRAGQIEASVATNSGAIASVQQTANGLTTTVGKVDDRVKKIEDTTNWTTKTGALDMDTLTTTQNIYYRDTNLKNADGEAGWAYIQVVSTGERVTQTVWHDRSSIQHTRTGAIDGSTYDWDAWNKVATNAQVVEVKQSVDGISTIINDPKTGLNATYQTAAGNATTISNVKSDVYQLETTANGLTSRVGNLESKTNTQETAIEQNKNAITLKADQTDVDTVKGTVAGLQSSLTVQGNQIQTKVSASDVSGMLKGYATQDYTQSLVTQQANTLSSTITTVKNQVNSLESAIDWTTKTGALDMDTLTTTQNIYYRDTNLKNADGEAGWAYIQVVSMGERVTQTVWHDRSSIQHTRTGAVSGSSYNWDAWNRTATNAQISNLTQSLDGLRSTVATKADQSEVTQLSNLIQAKVSSGDFTSTTTQLKNMINQRVQVGDVISQINQEAGGNTLIQVSNGKGSLILNAANTVITGKAWIPVAAIADLTADQIQAGTLSGSTIHLDDNNGNTIDLGGLATNYVGFHSKATNGDQTYIDRNGIYNCGATYATKISQGQITTNLLSVNGGGLIDFRSGGSGATLSNQEFQFYNSNSINGGISFSGSMPIAPVSDDTLGNELRIRYDRSFAVTPISDDSARICASTDSMVVGYLQPGKTAPDTQTTGLYVNGSSRYMNLGVWATDSTWARIVANSHNIFMQANDAHAWLSGNDNVFHIYRDNDGGSATATKLHVDGWAWVRGWVEAAGHSQHSALSTKTALQAIDNDEMLEMVNNTDLASFLFKTDVASGETHRHIGLIIDDVHDVAQYQAPQDFIAPNGVSRDDDNMIGALFGAVKALTKRIKILESKVG
ncbi:gp58-like family protein [Limosilactobacillus fermentum]|uniref:gp58-like family protein n=1 Tax=Limosilactobacillus fermentum TaxID=1613 RepID=UPI00301D29FF